MLSAVLCAFSPFKSAPSAPTSRPIYNGVPKTITGCSRDKREEMDKAAIMIQKIFRGYLLRELYRRAYEKRMAAQKEEARARRVNNRRAMEKAAKDLIGGVEQLHGYIQEHDSRRKVCRELAATRIQKCFRDYLYSNESLFRKYLLRTVVSFSDDETFRFIQFLTEKYNNSHKLSNLFWKELSGFDLGNCESPPYAEVLKLVIPNFRA